MTDKDKKDNNTSKKKLKTGTVNDPISKGRTLTGSRPDQINLNPIQEAEEKHAVFAFGRFNPPTTGHEKLIKKVESVAKQHNASAHVVASHSEGSSKNPLPKEKKVEYLKKVAGKDTHVSHSSSEEPSLLHQAVKLHKQGVKHLTMVAGSDRVDSYKQLLHKYNGVESNHGHYNFKSINVVSAGHRDPDAEGTTGISGTEMRRRAHAGDVNKFKQGLPKALHPHAQEIINHIKSVKESVDDLFSDRFIDVDDTELVLEHIAYMFEEEKKKKKEEQPNTHYITVTGTYGKASKDKPHEIDQKSKVKVDHKLEFRHVGPAHTASRSIPSYKKMRDHIVKQPEHEAMLKKGYHFLRYGFKNNQQHVEKINEQFDEQFGVNREAIPRSGQARKDIDLVVRKGEDRKKDDRPYRQQSIVKKILEANKSAWEKMLDKNPKYKESEKRAQEAKAGLQQAGKDYQAILDKEKKEVKEATTTSDTPVWEKPGPKGKSKKLSPEQITKARARARAAGRPYPNLVDNMAVSKK